ncbi:cupin domain-containing protein [Frankia sp. CNm7]|uniref:Cupin domain-containing protein n=1 Tax=Frankia nepalensis TaxID=1836974 RepID=A0A937RCX8_9ACTN|nr:cupin domain-containing protein [Frankia nepalensis]MBL7513264.1 cupin domain-containing protein [Frankia nepalensis]MBL7523784.1 cupin domain-containing protein [Frankia nepalensis]MBL7628145.1 cupin domain-containing protein [Frankia nepalensis]
MTKVAVRSLDRPDERRDIPGGHVDVVSVAGHGIDRAVFEPGWRWSESVRPIAGTELCEFEHFGYIVSGRLHIEMRDGSSADLGAGDAMLCPPGHDAWVVGDEPCVMIDVGSQATEYAKASGSARS